MPPWNLKYLFSSFVGAFGFYQYESSESVDATDFLMHCGGFKTKEIEEIVKNGLSMNDFMELKKRKDCMRFPARDMFLRAIDSKTNGLQKIIQRAAYKET